MVVRHPLFHPRILSGAPGGGAPVVPGAPILHFVGANIDGVNNTTLTPGQDVSTWVNLGSRGAAADAVSSGIPVFDPSYASPASVGKFNGSDGVLFDHLNFEGLRAALVPAIAQPGVFAIVYAATLTPQTGGPTADMMASATPTTRWTIGLNAGANPPLRKPDYDSGSPPALLFGPNNSYDLDGHSIVATFDSPNSTAMLDGVVETSGDTTGAESAGTYLNLSIDGAGTSEAFAGVMVEAIVYDVAESPAAISAYFAAKYGAFPQ